MRRVFVEWCVIVIALLGLAGWLSTGRDNSVIGRLGSTDAGFYDFITRLQPLPAPSDIAIVEIDEASLAQIGRWPWPRGVHAALLDRLSEAGARVIGLDILIAETGNDDATLAAAISRAPAVVLPVASDTDSEGRAWPIFPVFSAGSLSQLGHGHFSFDIDGVVRGFYLAEGGNPAFALVALLAGGTEIDNKVVLDALASATREQRDLSLSEGTWERRAFVLLPASEPAHVRFSYAEVLRGDTPLDELRGKTVLIGATAPGMRDAYSSSVVASETVVAGVELHASAMNAIARDRLAQRMPFGAHLVVIVLTVLLTMTILYASSPRRGLAAVVIISLLTLTASLGVMHLGWWMPPGGTIAAVLLAYPLWSWRRLETVIAGLIEQAHSLEAEPEVFAIVNDRPENAGANDKQTDIKSTKAEFNSRAKTLADALAGDETRSPAAATGFLSRLRAPDEPVTKELSTLRRAAERINALRLLLVTAVERLPHAALVCGVSGRLIIQNRLARSSFPALRADDEFSTWRWLESEFGANARKRVLETAQDIDETTLEIRDLTGRDWLMDAQHVNTDDLPALWLIQFTDITRIRELQRDREEMMRFISHDLRTPQVSIIGALDQIDPRNQSEWTTSIRHSAQHALNLAESFIQWTRAEYKPVEREEIDLADIITECVDAVWPMSKSRVIQVIVDCPETAPLTGDRHLIRRAIGNLIDNAFKYGGAGKLITVKAIRAGEFWAVLVTDRGPGLGDFDPRRLFDPYVRGTAQRDQIGTGLGLALVKMVATRHGGEATASNAPEGGASFRVTFLAFPDLKQEQNPSNAARPGRDDLKSSQHGNSDPRPESHERSACGPRAGGFRR